MFNIIGSNKAHTLIDSFPLPSSNMKCFRSDDMHAVLSYFQLMPLGYAASWSNFTVSEVLEHMDLK